MADQETAGRMDRVLNSCLLVDGSAHTRSGRSLFSFYAVVLAVVTTETVALERPQFTAQGCEPLSLKSPANSFFRSSPLPSAACASGAIARLPKASGCQFALVNGGSTPTGRFKPLRMEP